MSAEQPMQTGSDTSGATAQSQGAPQARTPMRVLEDLVEFTLFHGLQIQALRRGWVRPILRVVGGGEYPILVCDGRMHKITQYFINKVAERGWMIVSITAGPQGTLEVELRVDIALDDTSATQLGGDQW
jgi:hypothetical protein